MFKFEKNLNQQKLEEAILNVTESLLLEVPGTDEYEILTEQLASLYEIQNNFMKSKDGFSMDTLLTVGGNLAGILVIVNYERLNVVTSKALQLLLKIR